MKSIKGYIAKMDAEAESSVNTKIPEELRRVHFINMMYVADGPSDIPAFSLLNKNNGATFAIYPKGNMKAMKQVQQSTAQSICMQKLIIRKEPQHICGYVIK